MEAPKSEDALMGTLLLTITSLKGGEPPGTRTQGCHPTRRVKSKDGSHPLTDRSWWISMRTGLAFAKSKYPRSADRSSRASACFAYSFRPTSSDFSAAFHD